MTCSDTSMAGLRVKGHWRSRFTMSVPLCLLVILLLAVALAPLVNRSFNQRRAAGVIRQSGGQVSMSPRRWSDWVPSRLRSWIGEEYFDDVIAVDFQASSRLSSDQLRVLSLFGHLSRVDLRGSSIDNQALAHLGELPCLLVLDLSDCAIGAPGLTPRKALRQLQDLTLSNTSVDDADLAALSGLKNLQSLDLSGTSISDEGLRQLATLEQLQSLNLADTRVTGTGLAQLSKLKNLVTVNLERTKLASLRRLDKLRTLSLDGTQVGDRGMSDLGMIGVDPSPLSFLSLNDTQVGDAGLVHLKRFTALSYLGLKRTGVGDTALPNLTGLANLNTLDLGGIAERGPLAWLEPTEREVLKWYQPVRLSGVPSNDPRGRQELALHCQNLAAWTSGQRFGAGKNHSAILLWDSRPGCHQPG